MFEDVIVDQHIQPIEKQLGSSAIFNQDSIYDQNFNLNNNNNQDLTKHFDTYGVSHNLIENDCYLDINIISFFCFYFVHFTFS